MTQTQQVHQYVVAFDYGDGPQLAVCTTERMMKSIENAHYSGDPDDARYFSFHNGAMVEVVFRCIEQDRADEDDYLYSRWGVFRKDSGPDGQPFDRFTVKIDGRV